MSKYSTDAIRNVALAGAAGSGKTTLAEAFLFAAGSIGRTGRVEDGNTVSDFDELEKEFGHSFDSALVHLDHDEAHFNVIDTPGSSDFFSSALCVLPAIETAVVVVDASAGIGNVTRRMMLRSEEHGVVRVIVINKMDNSDTLAQLVGSIQEMFGGVCRPVNLPTNGGEGVIDCFANATGSSDIGDVADFHTGIVDQVVEVDEILMEQYLEQGEVSPEQLREPFSKALREGHLVPICFASARSGAGVKEIMDLIAQLCPSPLCGVKPTVTVDDETIELECDSSKPLLAHVFRVSSDPFVGKLSVFRVLQGSLEAGSQVHVDDRGRPVRIAHLFKLQGKDHEEVPNIIAGDIGAVAKLDELNFNSVIHSGTFGGVVKPRLMTLPKPMFGVSIEGKSKGAETKLGEALAKLVTEDPTLVVDRVQTTGETVLRGIGEQHLRMKLRLLKDRYGVDVATQPPRIAYKETITAKAEGHHRHKKQTGGAGQFGEVFLRVEPIPESEVQEAINGLLFVDATFGGSIPKQFMPAVEKGVRQVMGGGAIAGYPMQDIKVSVYDGKHHAVDSKEVAFTTAGRKAFVDGVQKARPVLLEPYVHLEITVPAGMIGDVSSDISSRRGRIQGTDMLPGDEAIIRAEAPLAEVMSYSSKLKSISGGAGSYTMEYSHDEPTPPNVQSDVVKAFKPRDDDD